jgi:hypothetical protein
VKHPAQNTSLKPLLFLIMTISAFTSSAVENIAINGDEVVITFNGGREYTYGVSDGDQFETELNNVIKMDESVGRFINQQIKSERLQQLVAA